MGGLLLERPLVCFDLETTGTDFGRDRIVEIGIVRLEPDGSRREWAQRVNPGMSIPPGATAVHGITDADVAGEPPLEQLAPRILELLAGADIAGFNSTGFDLPFLAADLDRVGFPLLLDGARHVDAMRIFHLKEPRDLSAAVRFYCARELEGAHSALADARATLDVLEAQVQRYADLPRDLGGLHAFCRQGRRDVVDLEGKLAWNAAGEAVFTFGKYRGKSLQQVGVEDPSYFRFLQREDLVRPFSPELRRIARAAAEGRFPERPQAAAAAEASRPELGDPARKSGDSQAQGRLF